MKRIMIVDDALFMRQLIADVFKKNGFEVCAEASFAKEAVEKYKQCRPDLVTMDIVMPLMEELDGIGAVREIIDFDSSAKIIICSVLGQQSLVVEAIKAGASDFVTKPVQSDRLMAAVRNILKIKE